MHGVNADGEAVLRQRLTRSRMLKFLAKLTPCLIGIEACASSHYWAREMVALGSDVKLTPAQYVNTARATAPHEVGRRGQKLMRKAG